MRKPCLFYTNILGMTVEHAEHIEREDVHAVFLAGGGLRIELLEPTSQSSAVFRYIQKKGEGIHHIALETKEINGQLDRLSASKVRLIDKRAKKGAYNSQIAFIHPEAANGVLFELCQHT
ncbi:VOC family protein [Virgibacillus halophilus]|uniref:VOC family protein n=1 Tax=Tigheibacillus halophilus TaxID=361280 RepID=A0ABU5CAY4_9BACI|nr:VOC family protein [Virgibacillus halophilus]